MNSSPAPALHLVFHPPSALAASVAADCALVEVARRHAPDLAPALLGDALVRLAPHYAGLVVQSAPLGAEPNAPRVAAEEGRPFAG